MLKPDGSCNPTKDKAWFGILTWVQPLRQTKPNKPRLVCSIFHLFRYIFSQVVKCEIWWLYTKRNLADLCRREEVICASEYVQLHWAVRDGSLMFAQTPQSSERGAQQYGLGIQPLHGWTCWRYNQWVLGLQPVCATLIAVAYQRSRQCGKC